VFCWLLNVSLLFSAYPQTSLDEECRRGAEAYQAKDFARAEGLLLSCIESQPRAVTPYLQLCGVYQQLGKEQQLADTALKALDLFPGEKRFYLAAGYFTARGGDYNTSIETLSRALQRWPRDPPITTQLMQGYMARGLEHLDRGRHEEAAADLRQVLELEPDNVNALLNLGRALHNLEDSLGALQSFERVLELDPETPLIQFHRGLVLHDMGTYDAAIEALSSEIAGGSFHPPSFLFRGLALAKGGEWEAALSDFTIAAERMPASSEAAFGRGRCLHRLGRKDEAEAAFRRSITLNPDDPRAHDSLGRLLVESGRIEEGKEELAKSRKLHAKNRSTKPGDVSHELDKVRKP